MENQRAQQYILKCVNLGPNDTVIHWANKSFSQTGFQVNIFSPERYSPQNIFKLVEKLGAAELIEWNIHKSGVVLLLNFFDHRRH